MTQYKDTNYFYDILNNGYDIYNENTKIIEQHDPYGKVFDPSKSYEENCLLQLDQMTNVPEPTPVPSEIDKLKANVDFVALMLDIDLPVEEEE